MESSEISSNYERSLLSQVSEVVKKTGLLGLKGFGGPNVHVLLFRRIFVDGPDPWLDERTFADLFSLSGALPGPGSTQLLFSIALVRAGAVAGLVCFLFWSLPGAIGMLLLSLAVKRIPTTLPSIALALLTGLNASAVGLIFCAALQLSTSTSKTRVTRLVLFGTASIGSCYTAIWLFPVLTFGGGAITLVASWKGWSKLGKRKEVIEASIEMDARRESTSVVKEEEQIVEAPPAPADITRLPTPPPESSSLRRRLPSQPTRLKDVNSEAPPTQPRTIIRFHLTPLQIGLLLSTFICSIIVVVSLREKLHNPPRALQLFTNLFVAGSILFGGGPVVIPLLQGYTVTPGWVSSQDFLFGFAILQAFPGPNFNFSVFLGALTLPHNPVLGGVLAFVGLFTPGILLKLALLPTYSRFREHDLVRNSLTGLNAAASGLVWTAVFRLWKVGLVVNESPSGGSEVSHSLEKSGFWIAVAGGAVVATQTFKLQPPFVILGGVVAGVLYGAIKGAP